MRRELSALMTKLLRLWRCRRQTSIVPLMLSTACFLEHKSAVSARSQQQREYKASSEAATLLLSCSLLNAFVLPH